jgi:hypothetical protein
MPLEARTRIKIVIHPNKGAMIKQFDVNYAPREKAKVYADDLHLVLLTEWRSPEVRFISGSTRVTFWLWTLFTTGSGTRPRTMVERKTPSENPDGAADDTTASLAEVTTNNQPVLTYGDCELTLYPPRGWLLRVDYRNRKGGGGKTSG